MKKIILLLSVIGMLVFSGCGAVDVPYKKYGDAPSWAEAVGYSDFEIGKNKYKVTYTGGVYDSAQKVMEFTYKRAKELCVTKGFNDYEFTNTTTDIKETTSDSYSYG